MSDDSFYLTLLSNSSTSYYPENTTAHFLTKLPKTIKLEGEWVVGLVEFHYPCTMFNVQEHENVLYIKKKVRLQDASDTNDNPSTGTDIIVEYKSHIPATTYDNVNNFLKAFNENPLLKNELKMRYDDISKLVTATSQSTDLISLIVSPQLSLQLGFEPRMNLILKTVGKYPINLYLGLPSQLFIYSDIIQPQIVGDVMTSLIRIIPLDPTKYIYGAYKMHAFSPAHYLPVMRREFDTIEIDIRTSIGNRVPFQFGTSCVKLHFRRIK